MRDSNASMYVILFFVVFALACSNPADNVPAAEVSSAEAVPSSDASGTEGAGGKVYKVAGESTVGFIGSKITGSHDGGFKGFEGKVILVDEDVTLSSVELIIDTTTLWSDNEKLTGHLKSPDFLDVESYPTATFKSTGIVQNVDGYKVSGNLDLHGVVKEISFPAQIEVQQDRITAKAEFSLLRFDFEIVYPGKPDDLIRDEVVVKFEVVALPDES